MNARTYWQKLRSIGWLDYVPKELHADIQETLERNLAGKDSWCAHVALAQTAFEWDDPPQEILLGLATCSSGVFAPKNVACKSTTLSFNHGGKRYSGNVPDSGEWPGRDVIDLANQALADSNVLQRFTELTDTPDFVGVVCVPPDIYAKAQKANLIPSQYRVDVCLVDRAEAAKVAGLKKIPARLEPVYVWDMTMELLIALLEMMTGKTKIKLRPVLNDPSARKTVYELPDDVIDAMAKFAEEPFNSFINIARKWRDLADLDKSYFDDDFLDLLADRSGRVCELAKKAVSTPTTIQIYLKGV